MERQTRWATLRRLFSREESAARPAVTHCQRCEADIQADIVERRLAGEHTRVYGGHQTIHRTGLLDVETRDGKVIAVWFRCMPLPFRQSHADDARAEDMARMYVGLKASVVNVEIAES